MEVNREYWEGAATIASNLSDLMLTLGEVNEAVMYGGWSVTHADRTDDWQVKMMFRTTHADALHQSGRLEEAEVLFREAEAMQRERQPEYSFLYSLLGYRFCDLLLGRAAYQEVMERVEKTIEWAKQYFGLLDVALDNLTHGRAWMMQAEKEGTGDFSRAFDYLDRAVEGLRESGDQDMLALALIKRAACSRLQSLFPRAWEDINEAKEIAELGDMKLHLVDYHLEAGRVCSAENKSDEANEHFKTAKKMIEETGYHRRDSEIMNYE